jgi:hemolysin-activating ACP:hemolysin acyltransferase
MPQDHEGEVQVAGAQRGTFCAVRYRSPDVALSLSVTLTMRAPAFAQLRFGSWSRVLVGQVNRGDYLILLDSRKAVGFGGWMPARTKDAERWLSEDFEIPVANRESADCAIVNAFLAPSREATYALRDAMLTEARQYGMIYGKRVTGKGVKRLVRLANSRREL